MSTQGKGTQLPTTKLELAQWKREGRDNCPVSFLTWGHGIQYVLQAAVNIEHTLDMEWREKNGIKIDDATFQALKGVSKFLNENLNLIKKLAGFTVDPNMLPHWAEYQKQFGEAVQDFAMNPTTPDKDKDRLLMLIVKVYLDWSSSGEPKASRIIPSLDQQQLATAKKRKEEFSWIREKRKEELVVKLYRPKKADWNRQYYSKYEDIKAHFRKWVAYLPEDLGPSLEEMDLPVGEEELEDGEVVDI